MVAMPYIMVVIVTNLLSLVYFCLTSAVPEPAFLASHVQCPSNALDWLGSVVMVAIPVLAVTAAVVRIFIIKCFEGIIAGSPSISSTG